MPDRGTSPLDGAKQDKVAIGAALGSVPTFGLVPPRGGETFSVSP